MDAAYLIIAAQFSIVLTALTLVAWYSFIGLGIVLLTGARIGIAAAQALNRKLYGVPPTPVWHVNRLQPKT